MKTSFDEIIDTVLDHEGGYVNDPKDLGGETKYGITKRFYPMVQILLHVPVMFGITKN